MSQQICLNTSDYLCYWVCFVCVWGPDQFLWRSRASSWAPTSKMIPDLSGGVFIWQKQNTLLHYYIININNFLWFLVGVNTLTCRADHYTQLLCPCIMESIGHFTSSLVQTNPVQPLTTHQLIVVFLSWWYKEFSLTQTPANFMHKKSVSVKTCPNPQSSQVHKRPEAHFKET